MVRPERFRMLRSIAPTTLVVLLAVSCGSNAPLTEAERAAIVQRVDSATRAFADAQRARDPDRVLAHVAPEFYMYQDGTRADYATVTQQIYETMPSLRVFETTWEPLEVTPLGRDHALATFLFADSVILGDGTLLMVGGPTTLVWERRGPDWLIIYADADHYPDSLP